MNAVTKLILWALAIVGGVVVVKKYVAPKLLGIGNDTPGTGKLSIKLISCSDSGSPVPGNKQPQSGYQSSPFWRWCYFVKPGDSAGSISERITGDNSRYIEILTANPDIPKKGKMGEVVGPNAWDFADGILVEGTKIYIPQTMNSWIDQFGITKAGHYPFPPDPRSVIEYNPSVNELPEKSSVITGTLEQEHEYIANSDDGFDYQGA